MPLPTDPPELPLASCGERLDLALTVLPAALLSSIRHVFGLAPNARFVDLRSAVLIDVVRAVLEPRVPWYRTRSMPPPGEPPYLQVSMSTVQGRLHFRKQPVPASVWLSKYTAPGAADGTEAEALRDALVTVVRRLHESEAVDPFGEAASSLPPPFPDDMAWPEVTPVEAEWVGYRKPEDRARDVRSMSEEERYAALTDSVCDVDASPTILYIHGGAFYALDPALYRSGLAQLVHNADGRCYAVRYRLAPQNPFPAALLDVLVSYLTLLYPPPGAQHAAVPAERLVIAGDSAGGNLVLALTRLLLDLQRHGQRLLWYGASRTVPLPAALTVLSPWLDPMRCSPTWRHGYKAVDAHAAFDYIPATDRPDGDALRREPCPIWPSPAPRTFIYAATPLMTHPLVSPILSQPAGWADCPPIYLAVGYELIEQEDRFFTTTHLHNRAHPVVFEQYEGMPHVFPFFIPNQRESAHCFSRIGAFARAAASGTLPATDVFRLVHAKTLAETDLDPGTLAPYTSAELRALLRAQFSKAGKPLIGSKI